MSDLNTATKILSLCTEVVESIDTEKAHALVDSILSSRRVFIYGSGRSGLIGQLFAVRLVQLGLDVHFIGEMTTPIITSKDLTLLISNTGRTSSVVQTATIAKRIGSKVISVVGKEKCDLANTSDISIHLDVKENGETGKFAPLGTLFEDSALLFFECIVHDIMERENITEQDMRNRHAIWV